MSSVQLPTPESSAIAHSERLLAAIRKHIAANGGHISFAEYMHDALYTPGLGYYSAGTMKFGKDGDFITAPEITPLFGRCLARYCQQAAEPLAEFNILEFGAGSGQLAVDILSHCDHLPAHYYILEVSADLRVRQQQKIRDCLPTLFERVVWLDALPAQPIDAIVIANEVLDAMPVERFRVHQGQIEQSQVIWQDGLREVFHPCENKALLDAVASLPITRDMENYTSEVNLFIPPWLQSISAALRAGHVLLIDYGFDRATYYHPQRHQGTLQCHYRHHHHSDALWYPGLQDITAHVDFTAVEQAAQYSNFESVGFSSQAEFLLAFGLAEFATQANSDRERFSQSHAIKLLTLPSEMGELFKVMALQKRSLS